MTDEELTAIESRAKAAWEEEADMPMSAATVIRFDVPALAAEVRRLREALLNYGRHGDDCGLRVSRTGGRGRCSCGLAAVLPDDPIYLLAFGRPSTTD